MGGGKKQKAQAQQVVYVTPPKTHAQILAERRAAGLEATQPLATTPIKPMEEKKKGAGRKGRVSTLLSELGVGELEEV